MSKLIIHLEGGLVQAVYYNGTDQINVEVMDKDISDYATEEEQEQAEREIEELESELRKQGMEEIY